MDSDLAWVNGKSGR